MSQGVAIYSPLGWYQLLGDSTWIEAAADKARHPRFEVKRIGMGIVNAGTTQKNELASELDI